MAGRARAGLGQGLPHSQRLGRRRRGWRLRRWVLYRGERQLGFFRHHFRVLGDLTPAASTREVGVSVTDAGASPTLYGTTRRQAGPHAPFSTVSHAEMRAQ